MSEQFEVVDRDDVVGLTGNGKHPSALTKAVLETAQTRQAIRVPLNGRGARSVYNSLWQTADRHGLRARTRRDPDGRSIYVWCEPKEPQP